MTNQNAKFQNLAHKYIPGGAHTYSRGDDQFPENAPKILSRGQGAYVWDVDGNKFLDYGMALRSVTLGYNNERVSQAAIQEILKGNNLTRASDTEVLAAQDLCELIPFCEMVKFAKNGSTVVTAATKLARSFTGKKLIARCANHPFFSFDDWFIGDTAVSSGVPDEIQQLTIKFNFNDIESVRKMFVEHPNSIAAVVVEPSTSIEPKDNFLQELALICKQNGTLFILDEMITGFRWHLQGACKYYDVTPDLVTYGKAMGNGFSVAALGGRKDVMELGGIHHDKERVFLISTTHGAEMSGLGAFREVLKIYRENNITDYFWSIGKRLVDGMNEIAKSFNIEDYIQFSGAFCSPTYICMDQNKNISLAFRTLFVQEMIKHNILLPWVALSYSHTEEDINYTLRVAEKVLITYKKSLENGIENYLIGNEIKPVFRKYN